MAEFVFPTNKCDLTPVTRVPGDHMIRDGDIPLPPPDIPDCPPSVPPILPPEAPCPRIGPQTLVRPIGIFGTFTMTCLLTLTIGWTTGTSRGT